MSCYPSRVLKKAASKAAASEEVRRTFQYVEPLSKTRTPLADFLSTLLASCRCHELIGVLQRRHFNGFDIPFAYQLGKIPLDSRE